MGRLRRHRRVRRQRVHARIDRGAVLQRCRNEHGSESERRAPLLHHPPSRVSRVVFDPRPAECVLRGQVDWRAVCEMKASTDFRVFLTGCFQLALAQRLFPVMSTTLTKDFSAPRRRFQFFHVRESFDVVSIVGNDLLRGQLSFWSDTKSADAALATPALPPDPVFFSLYHKKDIGQLFVACTIFITYFEFSATC